MSTLKLLTNNDTIHPNKVIIGGVVLNRITEGFLNEFSTGHNLKMLDIEMQFEHFANFCALSNEEGAIDIDILDMHTGIATQGIDGIAIEVNGTIINSIDEIESLIRQNRRLDVKFILVQAKTSENFDNTGIANFLTFVIAFFKDNAYTTFSTEEMEKFIEMKEFIYQNSNYMKSYNPVIKLYYVAPGRWNPHDTSFNAVIDNNKDTLKNMSLFSFIDFIPCDAEKIQQMYRKSEAQIESTFEFPKKITMFSDSDDDYGYSGVIPFKEFKKIITDENGSLRNVFEDNIRDFLGENNYVNTDIEKTIHEGKKSAFCMLNNGITIVAHSAKPVGDKMTIENYQIVNGCQTSHVLFANRTLKGIEELQIPVKIIGTKNEELKNQITKATNNQTGIKKEQLEALSTFQKTLEEYFRTYTNEDEQLFYERRVGQYRNDSIPKARIVSIRSQLKNAASMFWDKPHDAAGHYSTLLKDIGTRIFVSDDQPIQYYTSSLALLRFENLIKERHIPKEFRKGKYHAIMLFKYATTKSLPKHHNAKKMKIECEKILNALNSPKLCFEYFNKVVNYIKAQNIDLDERKIFERKETTDLLLHNKVELIKQSQ